MNSAIEHAKMLKGILESRGQRLVLAESCTAGRIAATLGVVPGVSCCLCGSFVIYRNDSKARWLGIRQELLDDPAVGPVSATVSELLATAILERTPEAEYGLAITGDVGPGAPPETDGTVFVACRSRTLGNLDSVRHKLNSPPPASQSDISSRLARLDEATAFSLEFALRCVSGT